MALPFIVRHAELARTARDDVRDLLDFYESGTDAAPPNRAAADNLLDAVEEAVVSLIEGRRWRTEFPAIYRRMARPGEQWLKVHRYWFGYVIRDDVASIFAVIDQSADMPRRL